MSEILVEVRRGEIVESRHYGDVAIVNSNGELLWYAGDPYRVTYARSSAKPWQTVPLFETGAVEAFQMSDEEIALCCASHSGENTHVEKVLAFLHRIGISPDKLQCGVHAPYHIPSYEAVLRSGHPLTAVHNNCSGKHSGMLALAKHLGADLDTYLNPDHPIQRYILEAVSDLCRVKHEDIAIGVDGCGVPVFGLPVVKMAVAYANLVDPSNLAPKRQTAVQRITNAMMTWPHLVAGTERFCTTLMSAGRGKIVAKAGAEGVYCVGLLEHGVGLAVKIDDGNARAAYPTVVEALRQSGLVSKDVLEELAAVHKPIVKNHKGTLVGSINPVVQLRRAI